MVPTLCLGRVGVIANPGSVPSRKRVVVRGAEVKAELTGKVELILTPGAQLEENEAGADFS